MSELLDRITAEASRNFRSFGGGQISAGNPISEAMKDRAPAFAAGVHIREVVDFVVRSLREPSKAMHDAARDWSRDKYGKPIGRDATDGCWKVMIDAALKEGK